MDEKYDQKTAALKAKHAELCDERMRLNQRLSALKRECDQVDEELTRIDLQFVEAKEIVAKRRMLQDDNATRFFEANKEMASARAPRQTSEPDSVKKLPQSTDRQAKAAVIASTRPDTPASDVTAVEEPVFHHTGPSARQSAAAASTESSPLSQPPDDIADATGAEVWDQDGNFVDHIKRPHLDNRFMRNILQIPVKRRVVVRQGRKFTKETMQSIYEPSDNKGAKWLSCMIQATGEEQDEPCDACKNRSGIWAGCVIVGGNDFPRCANCEWNRQGCSGSSYHQDRDQDPDVQANPYSKTPESPSIADDSAQASREGSSTGGFTPVNGLQARTSVPASAPASAPPKRTSLPTKKGGGRKSLPDMAATGKESLEPFEVSFVGGDAADDSDTASDDPGPEITAAGLHLRDDGTVFTEPEIMRGVPVERIHPGHPYWDPKWEEPLTNIRTKLAEWQAKHDFCVRTGKNRFLAGRQVNRGRTIVEFLERGDFHPFQLAAKRFISKGLVSYDTIFRLSQVIEELPKLGVDVTPVQWVRERMHEVYLEQGESFSLHKTVHELYHDPKLRALRGRAGIGNIGRPSGVKKGMTSKNGVIRPKDPNDTPKKRRRADTGTTKKANRGSKKQRLESETSPTPNGAEVSEAASPGLGSVPPPQQGDEFTYSGYTSMDSFSENKVTSTDWRVIQMRTPEHTTSTKHSQYLHWVGNADEAYFEHQVLLSVNPPSFAVYQEPLDFHVRLTELTKVEYTKDEDCPKVILYVSPASGSGDRKMLVHFKRSRTRDRFLHFAKHKLQELRHLVLEEKSK